MNKKRNVRIGLLGAALIFLGFVFQDAAAPDKAPVRRAAFKEDLSIGVKTGDPHYMFGGRIFIGVDDAGAIYVSDFDREGIQKYDAAGAFVMTIGRSGQGPGEFERTREPRWDAAGNLYVTDPMKGAIIFFDRSGRYLKTITPKTAVFDVTLLPDGRMAGMQSQVIPVSGKPPQYIGVYGLFDPSGQAAMEFSRLVTTLPPPPIKKVTKAESLAGRMRDALLPQSFMAVGREGRIYFGNSAGYHIDVYSPAGRKLQTIARDIPMARVGKKDIEILAESRFSAESEELRREAIKVGEFPAVKPAFRHLAPLEDGGLAVVVDITGKDLILIDLFDSAGKFLERVEAAISYKNLLFKNGKAYAVKTDAEGYNYVKRYSYSWK